MKTIALLGGGLLDWLEAVGRAGIFLIQSVFLFVAIKLMQLKILTLTLIT